MLLGDPQRLMYFLLALLIGLTFHEAAHAIVALWLGDDTAKKLGRVSLNPLVHLDPLGTIFLIVVAIAGLGIGWAKPVPVDPRNLRLGPQVGMALVAVAGPIANLIIAAIAAVLLPAAAGWSRDPVTFTGIVMLVNVSLAVFNMLPIPPLDGFRVVMGFLPPRQAYTLNAYAQYGPFLLLLLIMIPGNVLGSIIGPPVDAIFGALLDLSRLVGGARR